MSGSLESYVGQPVIILSCDGRCFSGTLKGFDQLINLILDDTHERIFSTTSGMEQISLGLKIIRGDNVSVIGLVDEAIENSVDFSKIRGEPLNPVVH
ncbi:CLUMA_CG002203, isoform A [Clunio marinus]|uniref:U6 snRNA-associated Sm-like protein LSm8 n=1 Tax=Clunio marinus TaxID=568069 RepID=A0A1J1HKD2_9DIPT|nr:CLUMA_CG002203, isoform A [Clunio marinus]